MTRDEIKTILSTSFPGVSFDETGEWLCIPIEANEWRSFALMARNSELLMDYLFCLTCIDWKTHLTMVYHLTSTQHRIPLVVKAKVDRDKPEIHTVSDIWRTAEFHEREVFELFGVTFINHPDLRKLILTDDFSGFPLRKDFEDPVNMIRL